MCAHALPKNVLLAFYGVEDGTQGFRLIGKQLHHTTLFPGFKTEKPSQTEAFLPGMWKLLFFAQTKGRCEFPHLLWSPVFF